MEYNMNNPPPTFALKKLNPHATIQGSGNEFNNYYNLCSSSNQHNSF